MYTKLEDLINDTVTKLNEATSIVSNLENIRWISPAGDLFIEPRGAILDMIEDHIFSRRKNFAINIFND